jgi:hypothetical protein
MTNLGTTDWIRDHRFDCYYDINDQNEVHNYYPDYVMKNETEIL